MEESILLCSSTIDPKMLASCSQIIAAFFRVKNLEHAEILWQESYLPTYYRMTCHQLPFDPMLE